jgi:glycosyltransferase involved in cell wall biosynthesis
MALLKDKPNIQLDVLGSGYEEDVKRYTKMVEELGLQNTVHLLGKVPNVEIRERMQRADLFFFTSVDDATSTVVPEAIGAGLPVICHALLGFGDIVDENMGRKIPAVNPDESAKCFARVISELEADRKEVNRLSANCIKKQYEISWDANARKMVAEYERILQKN